MTTGPLTATAEYSRLLGAAANVLVKLSMAVFAPEGKATVALRES